MRKLISNLFLFFLPILVFVAGINLFIDPANLYFKSNNVRELAKLLLDSRNVATTLNYDERLLQRFYIKDCSKRKEIVVFGSSRAMLIGEEVLQKNNVFNSSVSGASLEDHLGIYQMYFDKDIVPEEIILTIDPWIFNKNNNLLRWKSIRSEYYSSLRMLGENRINSFNGFDFNFEKLWEIFSFTYFQESLRKFLQVIKNHETQRFYPVDEKEGPVSILAYDGTRAMPMSDRLKSEDEVRVLAQKFAHTVPVYGLGSYSKLDSQLVHEFEMFVKFIKKNHSNIRLVLLPYHPYVYKFFYDSKQYQIVLNVEDFIRNFAQRENIDVLGSYDPRILNVGNSDFYDGMHPKISVLKRIFESN